MTQRNPETAQMLKGGSIAKKVALLLIAAALVVTGVKFTNKLTSEESEQEKTFAYKIDHNLLYTFFAQGGLDSALGAPYKAYSVDVHDFHATFVEYPFGSSPRTVQKIENPRGIVLYVHGFSDYFFQKEMAEKADSAGYAFFAIDLHSYGRSIAPGYPRSDMRFIAEHYTELDYAVEMSWQLVKIGMERRIYEKMRRATDEERSQALASIERVPLILMGHSQGGLISALYANDRPEVKFSAVILNSPFLDMNYGTFLRKVGVRAVALAGLYLPGFSLGSTGNPNYAYSLYKDHYGEWDYNTDWKPFARPVTHLRWVRAIARGQSRVRSGLNIEAPVLVMHSGCSIKSDEWVDEYTHCDGVLNVEHIKELAPRLGANVKMQEIEGGLHDLFLSKSTVRDLAYDAAFKFMDESLVGSRQ